MRTVRLAGDPKPRRTGRPRGQFTLVTPAHDSPPGSVAHHGGRQAWTDWRTRSVSPARWFRAVTSRSVASTIACIARCCSAPNNSVRAISSRCLRRRSCHHDAPDVTGPSNAKRRNCGPKATARTAAMGRGTSIVIHGKAAALTGSGGRGCVTVTTGGGSGGHAPTGSSRRPLATSTGAGGGPAAIRGRSSITLWPNLIRSSTVMPVESVPGSLLIVDPFVEPRSTSLRWPDSTLIRACRLLSVSSWRDRSTSPRPTVIPLRDRVIRRPQSGPAVATTSKGVEGLTGTRAGASATSGCATTLAPCTSGHRPTSSDSPTAIPDT